MAITKFTPQQVPFQASDNLRAFLDDQMQSIAPLLNNAAQRNEDEIIEGDWTFSGGLVIPESAVTAHQAALQLDASQTISGIFASARIPNLDAAKITTGQFANPRISQASVTQHQAALTILETQITDGSLLARVAANETINGAWTFSNLSITGGAIKSGVYTPTLVNGSNVDGTTAFQAQFSRVGQVVTVSGRISINPTSAGSKTTVNMSLPIAASFVDIENCAGLGQSFHTDNKFSIRGDTLSNDALIEWVNPIGTINTGFFFIFSYLI